jgi:hypothetical protein
MSEDSFELKGRTFPKWRVEIVDGEEVCAETQEWFDFKNGRLVEIQLSESGLTLSAWRSFDQYVGADKFGNITKLRKYISDFDKKFNSVNLYLWSHRNGTQKSTTAKIICYELLKQTKTVQFILMGTLLRLLTNESFQADASEDQLLVSRCRAVDFLVIDDSFDPNKVTMYKSGYQLSFLDMFLRQRIEENRRATCFTSNLPPESIDQKVFGVSMKALVVRSIPLPMEFNDGIDDFDPLKLWGE